MPFSIVRGDITKIQADAIVNAANPQLAAGGGVCGAIFAAAGYGPLQAACDKLAPIATGGAVTTPSFALARTHGGHGPRHIIHAVGPVWRGGTRREAELLASCYTRALDEAARVGAHSVAFPLISSGIYGYPAAEALDVATRTITHWLDEKGADAGSGVADSGEAAADGTGAADGEMDVYLTLVKPDPTLMAARLRNELADFLDHNLYDSPRHLTESLPGAPAAPTGMMAAEKRAKRKAALQWPPRWFEGQPQGESAFALEAMQAPEPNGAGASSLEDLLDNLDASFGDTLLAMIDQRGMTDAQVYRAANMSRQHFAKLRAGGNPSKRTVLALAIGMGLGLDDTRLLLERAGYALTHSSKADVIVEWFLRRGGASIYDVNLALYQFDQMPLN